MWQVSHSGEMYFQKYNMGQISHSDEMYFQKLASQFAGLRLYPGWYFNT